MSAGEVRIDTGAIDPWVGRELARCLLANMRKWYSDPENMAKFRAWEREREQRREGGANE